MQEALGARVRLGVVVCVATAGDLAQWHPHGQVLVAKLTSWRHPGFSAFVGRLIAPEDKVAIEDIAAYLVKPPVSLAASAGASCG